MPTPETLTTDKRVAVLLADGLEEIEALAAVDLLYRAGIDVQMLAVGDTLQVTGSHGVTIHADALLAEADLGSYTLVMLPGGIPGTPNLQADAAVVAEVRRRLESDLPLAAICAAPSVLARTGLLEGRAATCHPSVEQVLIDGGARLSHDRVVRDSNLLTSRGMGTAVDLGLELVRFLQGDQAVAALRQAIVLTD